MFYWNNSSTQLSKPVDNCEMCAVQERKKTFLFFWSAMRDKDFFLLTEEEGFAKTLVTLETSFCRLFGNSSLSY